MLEFGGGESLSSANTFVSLAPSSASAPHRRLGPRKGPRPVEASGAPAESGGKAERGREREAGAPRSGTAAKSLYSHFTTASFLTPVKLSQKVFRNTYTIFSILCLAVQTPPLGCSVVVQQLVVVVVVV